MIDFQNGNVFKLKPLNTTNVGVEKLLIPNEKVISAYGALRDYIVFTNRRIIAVNVQGITGKKKEYTTLPYSKIQAFSVETAGAFDLDSELELWFSTLGKVKFEFKGNCNIKEISQTIAMFIF